MKPAAKYPAHFERLWVTFDSQYGTKGSKKLALDAFKVLKVTEADVDDLVETLEIQKFEKVNLRARGEFTPPFQNVERWLRNRRFEDEECSGHSAADDSGQAAVLGRSDQRKADAVQRYLAKHLDDGVEQTGGSGGSVGRTGLNDLRLLEG